MLKLIGLIPNHWKQSESNDVYLLLANAAGSCAYYELPAYLAYYVTGRRPKPCLSPLAKSRAATGLIGDLNFETLEARKNEIALIDSKRVVASSKVASPSQDIIKELRRIFNQEQDKEAEGKAKHSKTVNKQIAKKIAHVAASHPKAPHICLLHLNWAQSICREGTQKRETPSLSTLKDYILTTANTLYKEAAEIADFCNLNSEEYQDIYISSLDFNQRMDQQSLLNQYYRFHQYLESKQRVVALHWDKVWASASLISGRINSNCVTKQELSRCTDYIESDESLTPSEKIQYAAALILMRNFGLRFSEAYTLQHVSIQYTSSLNTDQDKDIRYVQIKADNIYKRRGKSGSSVRSIPLLKTLSENHQHILEQLLKITELEAKDDPAIGLMRETPGNRTLIDRGRMNAYLNNLLKLVSGDAELHVHHLRHSFSSDVASAIVRMRTDPTDSKIYPNSVRQLKKWENDFDISKLVFSKENTQALRDLSIAIGHSDLFTTLTHYIHSIENTKTIGNANLFEDQFGYLNNRLTDKVAATILNETYDAYRARKGKLLKNSSSDQGDKSLSAEFAFFTSIHHHIKKLRISKSTVCPMVPYTVDTNKSVRAFKESRINPSTIQQLLYYFINGKDDEMVIERASQIFGFTHAQVHSIYQIAQKSARRSDYLLGPINNPDFHDLILSTRAHKRSLAFLSDVRKRVEKMNEEKLEILDLGLDAFISNLELAKQGTRATKKIIFDDTMERKSYITMLSSLGVPIRNFNQKTSSKDLSTNLRNMNFSKSITKSRSRSQYRREKSFVFHLDKESLSKHLVGNENTLLHCLFVLFCWRQVNKLSGIDKLNS